MFSVTLYERKWAISWREISLFCLVVGCQYTYTNYDIKEVVNNMYSYCKPEEMLQHAHGVVLKVTQTAVTCEIPRLNHNVDHSLLDADDYLYGSKLVQTCEPGYEPEDTEDRKQLQCNLFGKWDGDMLSCQPVKCEPPTLSEHVTTPFSRPSQNIYKSTVVQRCVTGYRPVADSGNAELICGADKEWRGDVLQCEPVECGPPNLNEHVRIEDASFTYKNTVHQECDPGYEPTSGATYDEFPLTCGADTEWTGETLECQPISCGPKPAFPNGYYKGGDIYRETTTPVCNPSASTRTQIVKTGGADKLTCDQNGNWVGDVAVCSEMCLINYFHQQMTRNGHSLHGAYKEKYALGEAVTYSCTPGHHGSLLYGCGGEGNGWRQTGGSCRRSCFPAASTVTYTDGSTKPLSAVKIGDEVMAVNPDSLERVSSKVTGFAYRDVNEKHNFITIKLENGQGLTVTDFHYTFVKTSDGAQKVIARDVKVGDVMYVTSTGNDSHTSHVVDIGRVDAYGVISPITEAGTVIVDGIYMSCFCQDKFIYEMTKG